MAFDWLVFFLILALTVLSCMVVILSVKNVVGRIFAVGFISGLFIYSGAGAAFASVSNYYLSAYFVSIFVFAITFCVFWGWALPLRQRLKMKLEPAHGFENATKLYFYVIGVYLAIIIVGLCYPEFKLERLVKPPAVDLHAAFMETIDDKVADPLTKLLDYARLLLEPFFYIALYYYRKRLVAIISIVLFVLYAQYAKDAYLGRGSMILTLAFLALVVWFTRPQFKKIILIGGILGVPILLVGAYQYANIRLGASAADIGAMDAIGKLFEQEICFPREVGMPIIRSNAHVDLVNYITWIITLPIPKLITGPIHGTRINEEISTAIMGLRPGDPGYYVVLPGFIAESVYLFGKALFWAHAVSIAFLAAIFGSLLSSVKRFSFLAFLVALMFAYNLNRAGISAILFYLFNGLFSFYVFVFYALYFKRNDELHSGAQ